MPASLYDWAGGQKAFTRMIDAFYDRVEADDLLAPLFPGGVGAVHRDHVVAWWCEVFGGPTRYSDELGGYEQMLAKHRNLAITPEQRFRFVSLMSLAADDAQLPDDPEFRSALLAATWSGARGWRGTTPSRGRRLSSTRQCLAGVGARLRRLTRATESGEAQCLSLACSRDPNAGPTVCRTRRADALRREVVRLQLTTVERRSPTPLHLQFIPRKGPS
jgi:hemoglobin